MVTQAYNAAMAELDKIADPGTLAEVLISLADKCNEAAENCSANWQDDSAGRPWRELAAALNSKRIAKVAADWR